MSGHTPGPWSVVDGHYPGFLKIIGPSFDISIVTTAVDIDFKGFCARTSDARLIAAAPELLEALESVKQCGFDDEDASGWGVVHITREDWDAVVFAIAKAKGEVR